MNKLSPIYRVDFTWNDDHYIKEVIAFDFGISHPKCLTLYYAEGGVIIIDELGIESIEITSLRQEEQMFIKNLINVLNESQSIIISHTGTSLYNGSASNTPLYLMNEKVINITINGTVLLVAI